MSEPRLSLDTLGIEIIKQALIWYYRAWSFYWQEEPRCCSIYAAESFVVSEKEAVCFIPRVLTSHDVERLQTIFELKLSFIAEEIMTDQSGYCIARERFEKATPLLRRLVNQIRSDYNYLSEEVAWRRLEKRGQEWRFGQAGRYREYYDGFHKMLVLLPVEGSPYQYSLMVNRPGEWRFSTVPPEGIGDPISEGGYRRHWNEVGSQRLENLDLFPDTDGPRLWRLAPVATGFKITRKETPSRAIPCYDHTPRIDKGPATRGERKIGRAQDGDVGVHRRRGSSH